MSGGLGATESAGAGQKHSGSNASAHSPTPWKAVAMPGGLHIVDATGAYVPLDTGNIIAIVRSMNACEGIADPSAIPDAIGTIRAIAGMVSATTAIKAIAVEALLMLEGK